MSAAARAVCPTWIDRLKLPVIAAPMFLVSSPELVVAACRAGVIGSFPAANARTIELFDRWCAMLTGELGASAAPWSVNLIRHRTYERAAAELDLVQRYRPPVVISSLGNPDPVVETVKRYGGTVYCDVSTLAFAERAARSGVDGLVLVCAGAGGHTGALGPFAFASAVRRFWSKTLILAGGIADGAGILAAQAAGADLVYVGTRFIAARESFAVPDYKRMLIEASIDDIVPSRAITGVTANWLGASLAAAGWTKERLSEAGETNFGGDLGDGNKAWKNVFSAGHGVGATKCEESTAQIVEALIAQYAAARADFMAKPGF